ncbi:shikimate dehydrogenase [Thalassotalea euphylliae]|nr:shikimate dehydrogenase [Thalassotalea euphylliae]
MDKYAVFGHPITQSKSPQIHQKFAESTQQNIEYTAIDPGPDNFEKGIQQFVAAGGKGCNITMPFKQQAYKLAGQLSERAKLAGAVNTLTFHSDGTISGDNTDGAGLVNDLLANGAKLNKKVLLIGAGGAARGVIKPLLDCQPELLIIVNRTHEKAELLADKFQAFGNIHALSITELAAKHSFDVIINSSSTSLTGELPPVPPSIFSAGCFAYDMVYQDKPTCFLTWAAEHGATTIVDGLGMLVGQAAESFRVWRGVEPAKEPVLTMLRAELTS